MSRSRRYGAPDLAVEASRTNISPAAAMTIETIPAGTTASQMGVFRRPSHGIGRGLLFPALDETVDSVIATSYPVQANATTGHGEGCGAGMGKGTDLADASFAG